MSIIGPLVDGKLILSISPSQFLDVALAKLLFNAEDAPRQDDTYFLRARSGRRFRRSHHYLHAGGATTTSFMPEPPPPGNNLSEDSSKKSIFCVLM